MVEINDEAIGEAVHEGDTMLLGDLVDIIERYHDDDPGAPWEAVKAYARELASRRDYQFDAEGFLDEVRDRLTDDESWVDHDRLYQLDGDRISQFPARWHAELGGSTDAAEYVRFVQTEAPEFVEQLGRGATGSGIPEDTLISVIQVVGRVDREEAAGAIQRALDDGALDEGADQNPQADVYLTERGAEGE